MRFSKKRKNLPISSTCRNCGTQTVGRYCHSCGQDIFAGRNATLLSVVYALLENVISLDNKVLRTLYYLFFRPGFLSAEYLKGRINRYVQPAKLYWFISIIFFALLTVVTVKGIADSKAFLKQAVIEADEKNMAGSIADSTIIAGSLAGNQQIEAQGLKRVEREQNIEEAGKVIDKAKQIVERMLGMFPYAMFIYLPFFALITYWLFRKKRRYYINHLVYTAHFHSFIFGLYSLAMAIGLLFSKGYSISSWVMLVLLLIVPLAYYFWSLRVYYKIRYVAVFFRGSIALLLNILIMSACLLLVAFYSLEVW